MQRTHPLYAEVPVVRKDRLATVISAAWAVNAAMKEFLSVVMKDALMMKKRHGCEKKKFITVLENLEAMQTHVSIKNQTLAILKFLQEKELATSFMHALYFVMVQMLAVQQIRLTESATISLEKQIERGF